MSEDIRKTATWVDAKEQREFIVEGPGVVHDITFCDKPMPIEPFTLGLGETARFQICGQTADGWVVERVENLPRRRWWQRLWRKIWP